MRVIADMRDRNGVLLTVTGPGEGWESGDSPRRYKTVRLALLGGGTETTVAAEVPLAELRRVLKAMSQ